MDHRVTTLTSPLLLIGWDDEMVTAARRLDVALVVVATAEQLERSSCPTDGTTVALVPDHSHLESVLAGLERIGALGRTFAAVHSNSERGIPIAAALGPVLKARSQLAVTAVRCRDKAAQKAAVRAAGLATADTELITDLATWEPTPQLLQQAFVVKPVAGIGSESTAVVRGAAEWPAVADRLRRTEATTAARRFWLREAFIDGSEWHLDGSVRDGTVGFVSLSRYAEPAVSFLRDGVLRGHLCPPGTASPPAPYRQFAQRACAALGLEDGVFHLEGFTRPDDEQLVFGELGARLGFTLLAEAIRQYHGFDLATASVQAALGWAEDARQPPVVPPDLVVGRTYLRAPPGVLAQRPSSTEVAARPGVLAAKVTKRPGWVAPATVHSERDAAGEAIVAASDAAALYAAMSGLESWFREHVVVDA